MDRKRLLVSLGAAAVVMTLMAAVAVVGLAFTFGPVQAEAAADDAVEVAPLQVETVAQPEVSEPVLRYEHASYEGKADGCPFSAGKMQLTEGPADHLEQQPLAQVAP